MRLNELPIEKGEASLQRRRDLKQGQSRLAWRRLAPGLVLAVMLAVVGTISPGAMSSSSLISFSIDAAPLLLLVLGSTLPILLGGIDLSAAAMASVSGVVISLAAPHLGSWSIPLAVALAGLVGAAQGYLHAKYQVPSFAISLGTLGLLSGVALFVTKATALPIENDLRILDLLNGSMLGVPACVYLVAAVWFFLSLTLRYLRLGRHIYAIGTSERAARMSGIDALRVRVIVFSLCSMCAALAGVLYISQTMFSSPTLAQTMLLPAIVGVVLGGTSISGGIGGVGASVIGGISAAFLRVGSVVVGLPPTSQDLVYGIVILVAVTATIDRRKMGLVK
ncbi:MULTISPECIES: ABC transporter permease [unclassified Caballeronia]|uniref:ABC transporter permease n=1 Tax=unclassified Caballeronia TaxID=2646786 RepID=UPI002028DE1D|nr:MULTISPECIES: ABC transporter permease [unclassified Caballeronia]